MSRRVSCWRVSRQRLLLPNAPVELRGVYSGGGAAFARLRLCTVTRLELLGEADEQSFRAADVAEPIHIFVLNHFASIRLTVMHSPFVLARKRSHCHAHGVYRLS